LTPLIHGGAQERGKRAGTENLPGVAAMVAALKDALNGLEEKQAKVAALRDRLIAGLKKNPARYFKRRRKTAFARERQLLF
jgi:cysteine desulfurase